MTDVTVDTPESTIVQIELRGKCGSLDFDTTKINDELFQYFFKVGLETVVNKVGMSKLASGITKLTGKAHEDAVAAVRKQAEKNRSDIYAGTIKRPGVKAGKAGGAVQTEAMRLARGVVKQLLRDNGYKSTAFDAKELTAMAKEVLAANPDLYKKAEANLAERKVDASKGGIDIKAMLGARADDPEAKAKPKVPPKPRAKGEKGVSAKQAGIVAPRQKPAPHVTH